MPNSCARIQLKTYISAANASRAPLIRCSCLRPSMEVACVRTCCYQAMTAQYIAYQKSCLYDKLGDGLLRVDIRGLLTLRSLLDIKCHTLLFLQRLETFALNFREVREQVFAAAVIRRDESKTLRIVKPLDST
jgi:hypothetical protein